MRDRVASPAFRLRKRVEKMLHRLLGDRYLPLYEMISFSRIPYATARHRAQVQDRRIMIAVAVIAASLIVLGGVLL